MNNKKKIIGISSVAAVAILGIGAFAMKDICTMSDLGKTTIYKAIQKRKETKLLHSLFS